MSQFRQEGADQVWVAARTPPELFEQELHVWCVDLQASQRSIEDLQLLLSSDERQRAEKFFRAPDRDRFILAHSALRLILSRYVGGLPGSLVFCTGPRGKPYLGSTHECAPRFNMSHSGDIAVYGVALRLDIGIDVEQVRHVAEENSIVDRILSAPERHLYHAASASEQRSLFFHLWTGHEARLKALGHGLTSALDLPGDLHDPRESHAWTIQHFEPHPGYKAAVATTGSIIRVRHLDWVWSDRDGT